MEIKEFQKKSIEIIKKIDNKLRVEHNLNNSFFHLIEETGELARELNKPNIRNQEIDKENLKQEIADILIFIAHIAGKHNIDIQEAFKDKLKKLNQRYNLENNDFQTIEK